MNSSDAPHQAAFSRREIVNVVALLATVIVLINSASLAAVRAGPARF